jgi:hypothetical protein
VTLDEICNNLLNGFNSSTSASRYVDVSIRCTGAAVQRCTGAQVHRCTGDRTTRVLCRHCVRLSQVQGFYPSAKQLSHGAVLLIPESVFGLATSWMGILADEIDSAYSSADKGGNAVPEENF